MARIPGFPEKKRQRRKESLSFLESKGNSPEILKVGGVFLYYTWNIYFLLFWFFFVLPGARPTLKNVVYAGWSVIQVSVVEKRIITDYSLIRTLPISDWPHHHPLSLALLRLMHHLVLAVKSAGSFTSKIWKWWCLIIIGYNCKYLEHQQGGFCQENHFFFFLLR